MPPCVQGGGTAPAPSPPAPAPAPYSDATCSTGILHYVSGAYMWNVSHCVNKAVCIMQPMLSVIKTVSKITIRFFQ
jgi:hypothetical protein